MDEEQFRHLQEQARKDRKLMERAMRALAEIDRAQGLSDDHADVLAALRIRIEGKERGSLEDLISAAGKIAGKKDLGEVLSTEPQSQDWPSEVKEEKKEWPGL